MAGINKVILLGRLGKAPEVRVLESGVKVATASIATGESYKDQSGNWQEKTEWHRLVFWRDAAERAERLKKGDQIYVEGKLTTRSWEQDGVTKYVTEVVVNYSQIINRADGTQTGGGGVPLPSEQDSPHLSTNVNSSEPASELATSKDSDNMDDLPF